jgi:hypothetical protein
MIEPEKWIGRTLQICFELEIVLIGTQSQLYTQCTKGVHTEGVPGQERVDLISKPTPRRRMHPSPPPKNVA